MKKFNTGKMNVKLEQYLLLGTGLLIGYLEVRHLRWMGNQDLHSLQEMVAHIFAGIIGILALIRYYAKKNGAFLFIGLGFIATAFLDGYHVFVSSHLFELLFPLSSLSMIAWSESAPRIFLSLVMLISCWLWTPKEDLREQSSSYNRLIYFGVSGLALSCLAFFALFPLPRVYYPELFFGRPQELIPALFYLGALVLYFKKALWKTNDFHHWLVLSLMVGFVGQAFFMSFSFTQYDIMFTVAHFLKNISYVCVLIGLLCGIVLVFKKNNDQTRALELMQSISDLSNEDIDRNQLLHVVITRVCQFMSWPVGHIYLTSGSLMVPLNIWYVSKEKEEFNVFKDVTMKTNFDIGIGLPGRVLKSKKAAWIKDVTKDANFPRAKVAENIGVKAGLGFPVLINGEVEMVMEYYSNKVMDADEDLIVFMHNLGVLIGQIIEKQDAEKFIQDQKMALDEHAIVAVTDVSGKITYVNDKFCEISKYSREELMGQDHRIINSGYHPKEFMKELWQTIARGNVWKGEIQNKAKDGSYYWVDTTIIPFMNQEGKPYQYMAIRADITSRKKFELDLDEQNKKLMTTKSAMVNMLEDLNASKTHLESLTKKLENSNQELEQFAYVASHDLKEPLRKIISFGDLLEEEYAEKLEGEGQEYLERMQNAAGRMKNLIDGLLDYSRVATQAKPFVDVDLNKIVSEVLNTLELRIKENNGKIEIDPLPTIKADELQMFQLFQNVIGNGLKYKRDGVDSEIQVHVQNMNNGHVHIEIKDNGVGFEQKYADQIFAPFRRLHGRTQFEGTGIGLSICQKIVLRHDGKISAQSEEGKGSTFMIDLPFNQKQNGETHASE